MSMNVSLTDELSEFVKANTEETRLTFLRAAWTAGRASGDAGPADFADIKAQGRARLKAVGK